METNTEPVKGKYDDDGLYEDMPFEDYVKLPAINSGGLKRLLRSPKHYKTPDTRDTDALAFGRLMHVSIFEPDRWKREAIIRPKFNNRSNAGKAEAAAWDEAHKGLLHVSEEWLEKINAITESVYDHPLAAELLSGGVAESTLVWHDQEMGVRCKARYDYVSESFGGVILDLKTTTDASPESFSRDAWKYRYDIQAAHYTEGARVMELARHDVYAWLVVEKEPPYGVAVYVSGNPLYEGSHEPDAQMLGLGRQWRQKALETYTGCLELDSWPCYSTGAIVLAPPGWAKPVEMELEQ